MIEPTLLSPGATHVHRLRLAPGSGSLARAAAHLSPEEEERAAEYRFARDREAFVLAHGAVREILSSYTGLPPRELRIATREGGKPYLLDSDLRFNLSHSGQLALLAVGRTELGVDVERRREDLDVGALAERFFSAPEVEHLARLAEPSRTRAFFAIWTRKEAYLKATGDGLSLPLSSFAVGTGTGAGPHAVSSVHPAAETLPVTLHALSAGDGYAAALVVLAPDAPAPRLFGARPALGEDDEDGERRVVWCGPPPSEWGRAPQPLQRQA